MCHFKAKDLGNKASAPESMGLAAHTVTLSILAQQMLSNWVALHSSVADSTFILKLSVVCVRATALPPFYAVILAVTQ